MIGADWRAHCNECGWATGLVLVVTSAEFEGFVDRVVDHYRTHDFDLDRSVLVDQCAEMYRLSPVSPVTSVPVKLEGGVIARINHTEWPIEETP